MQSIRNMGLINSGAGLFYGLTLSLRVRDEKNTWNSDGGHD